MNDRIEINANRRNRGGNRLRLRLIPDRYLKDAPKSVVEASRDAERVIGVLEETLAELKEARLAVTKAPVDDRLAAKQAVDAGEPHPGSCKPAREARVAELLRRRKAAEAVVEDKFGVLAGEVDQHRGAGWMDHAIGEKNRKVEKVRQSLFSLVDDYRDLEDSSALVAFLSRFDSRPDMQRTREFRAGAFNQVLRELNPDSARIGHKVPDVKVPKNPEDLIAALIEFAEGYERFPASRAEAPKDLSIESGAQAGRRGSRRKAAA